MKKIRCPYFELNDLERAYHDEEWGLPVRDDVKQFKYLMMEVMQCGLSWNLMMLKREIFRSCFDGVSFDKIAVYGESDIKRILETPGMIRSRRKIEAIIRDAKQFMALRRECVTFSKWLWAFSDGKTILYDKHGDGLIPDSNGLSERISAELRRRGFRYLGPVTVYSHLQASGIINDHGCDCPRFAVVNATTETIRKRRYREQGVVDFGSS